MPELSGRRDFDWALSLLSLLGALGCSWLLLAEGSAEAPASTTPAVASLSSSRAEVRRRSTGTLAWNELGVGTAVYELDSVFVPPGSGASLTFDDGSHLDVSENSLVVIERPAANEATQVQLVRGSASGVSGKRGMELRGGDWLTTLPANAGAKVDLQPGQQPHVEVFAGTALVKTRSETRALEENQAADLGTDGALVTTRFAVTLTSPARGARHYFQKTPAPIVLAWRQDEEKALTVELSLDRQVVLSAPALGGTLTYQPEKAGTFWWRITGADGQPRSELRRLEVLEDRAPIGSSPGSDEQIDTAARSISFAWSEVQGAPAYRLEISRLEDFSALVFSAQAGSNRLTVRDALPEGPYHWRVRTLDAERGESPFSEPRTFILIDRPLPDAPELIDSALEVTGGKKQR